MTSKAKTTSRAVPPGSEPPFPIKQAVIWTCLAFLVMGVALVFVWLPQKVEQTPSVKLAETQAADAQAPLDAETLLAQRQQSQQLQQQLLAAKSGLSGQAVEQWGESDWRQVSVHEEAASRHFEARHYAPAIHEFEQALAITTGLQALAVAKLTDALEQGAAALESGNSQLAKQSYDLALAIDANHVDAQRGRARAENLDAVLAALATAQTHEQEGSLAAASAAYQQALSLDSQNQTAKAGLARLAAETTDKNYVAAMSRGLAALEAGQFQIAEQAFTQALKYEPNSQQAQEGLVQARLGGQTASVARLHEQAVAFELEERWQKAMDNYAAILGIDESLAFAKTGLIRTNQRARLDGQLQAYINTPQTLYGKQAAEQAEGWFAQAQQVKEPGPRLQHQMVELGEALRAATTPIPVVLQSDGQTDVMVYKVGKFGAFKQRELSLRPGDYTVVGRCAGYHDERLTLSVRPDAGSPKSVDIRCREKI